MHKAIIEMPQGTQHKYEYDNENKALVLDRVINQQIPQNYGFIQNTKANDEDPLDIFILANEPIPPLTEVRFTVLGAFICEDCGVLDEKIVAIIEGDSHIDHVSKIPGIVTYLTTYKEGFEVLHFVGKEEALNLITKYTLLN